jgi:hypothetical protein
MRNLLPTGALYALQSQLKTENEMPLNKDGLVISVVRGYRCLVRNNNRYEAMMMRR